MRKVLILAALTLSMYSCKTQAPPAPPAPYTTYSTIDYSSLTSEGYFVTESNSVPFDYEAISSILIEVHSGWIKRDNEDRKIMTNENEGYDDYYYAPNVSTQKLKSSNKYKYVIPDSETAISKLKNLMKQQGADGILNLKIGYVNQHSQEPYIRPIGEYICITGMLFKRK